MSEIQQCYRQMKNLEAENMKLNIINPALIIPAATVLFLVGVSMKSTSMPVVSFGLFVGGMSQLLNIGDLEKRKDENQKLYYEKVCQMHFCVQRGIRMAFEELRYEESAKRRREIMDCIRWMKKNDVLRNVDKKALVGFSGHKRKGLALGLKTLRKKSREMTHEEYINARENIFSYY